MSFEFKFIELTLANGTKRLLIETQNPEYALLSLFLTADIHLDDIDDYLTNIVSVMEGEMPSAIFSGNACYVEVHRNDTMIEALYPESLEESNPSYNIVNTDFFYDVFFIWKEACNEYLTKGTLETLNQIQVLDDE